MNGIKTRDENDQTTLCGKLASAAYGTLETGEKWLFHEGKLAIYSEEEIPNFIDEYREAPWKEHSSEVNKL